MSVTDEPNFAIIRECLSTPVLRKAATSSAPENRKRSASNYTQVTTDQDAAELAEFIDYLSQELYISLPTPLRTASHADTSSLKDSGCSLNTNFFPSTCLDSLLSYSIVPDPDDAERLLKEVLQEYISAATAPPPVWSHTKAKECEICEREVPLTYHHLIPREVHKKALKRGWHPEWMLNSVAWLCRPCHSTVHRLASNEVLARELYTVEKLLEVEEIERWRGWVGKQRWGKK